MDWEGIEGHWWRLRRPRRSDEAAIAAYGRRPNASWIGIRTPGPPERARQVVDELLKGAAGNFGLVHLAVLKDGDVVIGMVGAQEHGPEVVEIVYGVAPAWRGRGLATELLAGVTRAASEQDPGRRYELVISPENAASIRVAEKCGYRFVRTRNSFIEATGQSYDDLVYIPGVD